MGKNRIGKWILRKAFDDEDHSYLPKNQEKAYKVLSAILKVAECGSSEFTDEKRLEMSVAQFIDHWLKVS
ncbi:hypothetical protein SSX86_016564 [Deinandra increscens subsp. villosa]|uniref:Uncharacterized protein n=1 Tax=Deinandra increscens subsp. villosa TaxID=3103831 RepID=A0AAP0CZX2_9ASTR